MLKYPLLLQGISYFALVEIELLNVTSPSHSDFECVELAAKEITKVAERINVPSPDLLDTNNRNQNDGNISGDRTKC